jgi:patatin-like phospholipase/acyl hydrolase
VKGGDIYAYEAAMRTSAAPVFFPIYQGFCDGGIISKDPGMMAVSKVSALLSSAVLFAGFVDAAR